MLAPPMEFSHTVVEHVSRVEERVMGQHVRVGTRLLATHRPAEKMEAKQPRRAAKDNQEKATMQMKPGYGPAISKVPPIRQIMPASLGAFRH